VTLYWNDVRRGTVDLLHGGWKVIQLPVGGPGVLRVVPARTFRPLVRTDGRRLGIETGVSAVVAAVP
jgi:hypothetical protein